MTAQEEEFKKRLERQRMESIAKHFAHTRISAEYNANRLVFPEILWHVSMEEIDLSLQPDSLDKRLLVGGCSIIAGVDIEKLFDEMREADGEMFRRKKLYSKSFNSIRISAVLDCWQRGQKLVPPTVVVFDKEYAETLQKTFEQSHELIPVDGKHRLNAAYCLGATTIPILVRNKQLNSIKRILLG